MGFSAYYRTDEQVADSWICFCCNFQNDAAGFQHQWEGLCLAVETSFLREMPRQPRQLE
jgi:hypothetical protein